MSIALSLPRIPSIGEFVRGQGTLVAVQTTPPPPPPPPETDYIFEEITARCEVRFRTGEVLQAFNEVWDFYGKGASVTDSVEVAQAYAQKHGLGRDSDLEVVALRIATQHRRRLKDSDNLYAPGVANFERLSYGARHGLPAPEVTVAWSSKTPGAAASAAVIRNPGAS